LTFFARDDGNLKILPLGATLERLTSIYGQTLCFSAISSTTGDACSCLDPYVGLHIRTVKLIQGILIVTSIGWSIKLVFIGSVPEQDLADDYLEIGGSTYMNPVEEGRLIVMVALTGGPLQNSSNRYPIIGRSEASDARTPNDEIIWNLNPDFNTI
jgi:hypothetical protein